MKFKIIENTKKYYLNKKDKRRVENFIKRNEKLNNEKLHIFSEKNKLNFTEIERYIYQLAYNSLSNKITGGKGDNLKQYEVNKKELEMGGKTEMEHTNNKKLATDISMDHLEENPHYYSILKIAGLANELV